MRSNFAACHAITARWEGGWSDHAADPGGATKYGITIGTLSKWRGRSVSKQEVRDLTRPEAEAIYKAWYWDPVKGDALPAGLDLVTYDAGVNSGPARGAKWTQSALGVAADGKVGAATLAAAAKANVRVAVQHATDARLTFMMGLATWKTFGKGWGNRVGDVRARALAMAGASRDAVVADAIVVEAKGDKDAEAARTTGGAGAATGAGGAGADLVSGVDWTVLAAFGCLAAVLIVAAMVLARRAAARRAAAKAMLAVARPAAA